MLGDKTKNVSKKNKEKLAQNLRMNLLRRKMAKNKEIQQQKDKSDS